MQRIKTDELIPVRRGLTTVAPWSAVFDLKTPVTPVASRSVHRPYIFSSKYVERGG